MPSLSRFSDVSEEELNTYIQKADPEKPKIATKYDIKFFEGKKKINLKYQLDSFTRQQSHIVNIETNETWQFQKHKYFYKIVLLLICFFFRDFY